MRLVFYQLKQLEDKAYSLCDASSVAVVERPRIREAIVFARHFPSTVGSRSSNGSAS